MVKTSPSNAAGAGLIPGLGAKIPRASRPENQNIKQKQYCNKFSKNFIKMVHIKKLKKSLKKVSSMKRSTLLFQSHFSFDKSNYFQLSF